MRSLQHCLPTAGRCYTCDSCSTACKTVIQNNKVTRLERFQIGKSEPYVTLVFILFTTGQSFFLISFTNSAVEMQKFSHFFRAAFDTGAIGAMHRGAMQRWAPVRAEYV